MAVQKQPGVFTDIKKNRLYITITGHLSKEQLERFYTDVRFGVADLKPGFDVVNDLRDCTLAALSGMSTFKKITNYLIINRVSRVVRVVDNSKVVFKQILNIGSRMQGYKAVYVETLEDADRELDLSQESEALRFYLRPKLVKYILNGESGEGQLLNISTVGCTIESPSIVLVLGDIISLSINFEKKENLLDEFSAQGKIVAVDVGEFTLDYIGLDEHQREQLWQRLVDESQCEV